MDVILATKVPIGFGMEHTDLDIVLKYAPKRAHSVVYRRPVW